MRHSKYWDDFERRINETVNAIKTESNPPVRRVAIFITNMCNFKCHYCNVDQNKQIMTEKIFDDIVKKYGQTAALHITGGEPSIVPWLYHYIDKHPSIHFNLNSNLFLSPPKNIKRLKVSLDSQNPIYFNKLVNKKGAFEKVINNIKKAIEYTTVSITCTLTKENYLNSPDFMKWCRNEFPNLYAVFFSVYKGKNDRFQFNKKTADDFFINVKPRLESQMDKESLALLSETIDEKKRIMQGIRFPENYHKKCFISMSERTIDHTGIEYNCSHLYRDGIKHISNEKNSKCLYGCNRRLIMFNQEVSKRSRYK